MLCNKMNKILVLTLILLNAMAANAQIEIGERIPSFELVDQQGNTFRSDDHVGTPLVVFFYPKDHTPGCTAQACSFRDHESEFAQAGALVVGVNSGSVTEHAGFSEKYDLKFPLLSDPGHQVRKSFGSPGLLFNQVANRVTYVTDKDHKVAYIFKSLSKATDHVTESLNYLKAL
jgi:thioredoxin-dependent peroxiredoxin